MRYLVILFLLAFSNSTKSQVLIECNKSEWSSIPVFDYAEFFIEGNLDTVKSRIVEVLQSHFLTVSTSSNDYQLITNLYNYVQAGKGIIATNGVGRTTFFLQKQNSGYKVILFSEMAFNTNADRRTMTEFPQMNIAGKLGSEPYNSFSGILACWTYKLAVQIEPTAIFRFKKQ